MKRTYLELCLDYFKNFNHLINKKEQKAMTFPLQDPDNKFIIPTSQISSEIEGNIKETDNPILILVSM